MAEHLPQDPKRLKAFATFFKNYMSVWALVVAALPVPLSAFKLIPVYEAQRGLLSTFTTLFCFLTLGFVFFSRHALARYMFGYAVDADVGISRFITAILPAVCIVVSIALACLYYYFLTASLGQIHVELQQDINPTDYELKKVPLSVIPHGFGLFATYFLCFLFAESAFILMSVREYMQDVLGLTETELIHKS